MSLHRRSFRLVALAIVLTLPFLLTSGVASAKAAKGCHKTHTCKSHGGGSGGGTGGTPAPMTVTASPNPLVETGQSVIVAVIQVESSPSFAGDTVDVGSSQLRATCSHLFFESFTSQGGFNPVQAVLDDDGNTTVSFVGVDCAPGSSVIEASMANAPYYTALTTLVANPPVVTPEGLTGYPNPEVETGDTLASGDSDVFAVFYVETNPVYAEQPVEISSAQLEARCGALWEWTGYTGSRPVVNPPGGGPNTGPPVQATLDDDGNAVFAFAGESCAPGDSQVIADVLAGTHPTYVTTFTILPPAPTI